MNILSQILSGIKEKLTGSQTSEVLAVSKEYGTYQSGNRGKWGNLNIMYLTFKTTTNMNAGTEYVIGKLNADLVGMNPIGICTVGIANVQATGDIRVRPTVAVNTSSTLYIKILTVTEG